MAVTTSSGANLSNPRPSIIPPSTNLDEWIAISESLPVSISATKGLFDNFELPLAPTDNKVLYYEYSEHPEKRDRAQFLSGDESIFMRVQDAQTEVLKVVEYENCEHLAQFLNKKTELRMNMEIPDRQEQPWASGISLEAAGESSILFIRVPYLGFKGVNVGGQQDSLKLDEWRQRVIEGRKEFEGDEREGEMWVHQAWVVVIRLETILTAKSACDQSSFRPRLLPLQKRSGIFHAAIHIIAGILRSSDSQVQTYFTRNVAQFERQSKEDIDVERIASVLVEAITIRHLLADQITVLELLQPLFVQTGDLSGIATGSEAGSIGRGNGDREEEEEEEDLFTAEVITIPVISASSKIEVRRIHAMIRKVIAQRKGMQDKMAEMIGSLKDMCKSTEQEVIKETVKEQLRNAELLGDEITTQGKTLSMFTAVNVLFLPLGFFSQFMALDSVKTRINTQSLFWAISGPVTALFVTITLYYVIISQYETRKIMRFLWILLRHQRWQWPLKRADARTQMMYLCGLPKYKVKVIEDVPTPARQLYLMNPDGLPEGKKLRLAVDQPGEFRFDQTNNYLFLDLVDKHDYMYFAHMSPCIPRSGNSSEIEWRRIRLPLEREPLYFKGRFEVKEHDLWAVMSNNGKIMWDKRLGGSRTRQLLHDLEPNDNKKLFKTRDFALSDSNTLLVNTPNTGGQDAPQQQLAHPPPGMLWLKMELVKTVCV